MESVAGNPELSRMSVRIPIQDYKSIRSAVVYWLTHIRTQTRDTDSFWLVMYD